MSALLRQTVREYLSVRLDYRERGTKQFNLLTVNLLIVDAQRLAGSLSETKRAAKTRPDSLKFAREDGSELVSCAVHQGLQAKGATRRDLRFKRPR